MFDKCECKRVADYILTVYSINIRNYGWLSMENNQVSSGIML